MARDGLQPVWIAGMADYGDAVMTRKDDGTVVVDRAAPVIGVTVELLADLDVCHVGPDGLLWLDTAGRYRYRPVRFSTEPNRVLICERVV